MRPPDAHDRRIRSAREHSRLETILAEHAPIAEAPHGGHLQRLAAINAHLVRSERNPRLHRRIRPNTTATPAVTKRPAAVKMAGALQTARRLATLYRGAKPAHLVLTANRICQP